LPAAAAFAAFEVWCVCLAVAVLFVADTAVWEPSGTTSGARAIGTAMGGAVEREAGGGTGISVVAGAVINWSCGADDCGCVNTTGARPL
jgi:hypothetical protein